MIDEMLRAGLRDSAARGGFPDDALLDDLRAALVRDRARVRVLRRATVVAVLLTLFVGVALFLAWRARPDRYRTTATVRVAAAPSSSATSTTLPEGVVLQDPRKLALAPGIRRAALLSSHLASGDTKVSFRVTADSSDLLSFVATAPTASQSTAVTRNWVQAFASARRVDARQQVRAYLRALRDTVTRLHRELQRVDAQLARLDPIVYGGVQRFDAPSGDLGGPKAPPPVPERGSVREFNLAFERVQILTALRQSADKASALRILGLSPQVFTTLVSMARPVRVDTTPPMAVPAIAGWFLALVLVFAIAAVACRRGTRSRRGATTSP